MSISSRKIIHYSVKIDDVKTGKEVDAIIIDKCFKAIVKLDKLKRVYDNTEINRFHFLFSYNGDSGYGGGFFKSAKYNHRPDLIDKENLAERQNPKRNTEGEGEKTHFGIGFDGNEALLLLETKRDGVQINTFKSYLEAFLRISNSNLRVNVGLSVKGNFKDKLKDLERVSSVEIYTPYTQVSDTFGNIPISKGDIKEDAIITLTAKRSHSIKGMVSQLYSSFSNKQNNEIGRIRVYGQTVSQSDVLLDTNRLKDHDTIKVTLDANKQVTTESILPAIKKLVHELL